jgi:outer membrane cobalamin receptor
LIQPNKILQERRNLHIDTKAKAFSAALAYFLFGMQTNVFCSEKQDTIVKTTQEVRVNAERIYSAPATRYSSARLITESEIKKISAFQTDEILKRSPGVYIKNYGGAGGMKTISIRGANSMQNVTMIDGEAINSSQNASVDLSLLPAGFVKSIEVSRGGASDAFGSGSMSGAVNIITNKRIFDNKYSGLLSYGSYGDLKTDLGAELNFGPVYGLFSAEYVRSDGDYKFDFNEYGKNRNLSRKNAQFNNLAMNASIGGELQGDMNWSLRAIGINSDRGVPGAVVQGREESLYATLQNKTVYSMASLTKLFDSGDFIKASAYIKYDKQLYRDPDSMTFDDSRRALFIGRDARLSIKSSILFGDYRLNSSVESSFSELRGGNFDKLVGSYVKRANVSAGMMLEKDFILRENVDRISVAPSVRGDVFSDNSPFLSYSVSILYNNSDLGIEVKTKLSHNFRMPSFNEMYYLNYGTRNLKPEQANSLNLTLSKNLFNTQNIELSYFYIDTKDQIISVPKSPIKWSAGNVAKVVSQGVEAGIIGSLFGEKLNYSFSYTWQSVLNKDKKAISYDKRIAYTPEEILSANIDYKLGIITLGASMDYSSFRYSLPDESYDSMLPSYTLIDLFVSTEFKAFDTLLRLKFETKNIGDVQYCVVKNYPMPGVTFSASIGIAI